MSDWLLTIITLFIGVGIGAMFDREKQKKMFDKVKDFVDPGEPVGVVKKLTPAQKMRRGSVEEQTDEAMSELIEEKIL